MESSSSSFECQFCGSYDSLKNCRQISPIVRNHLKKVYLALCCALVAFAVGVYLHFLFNIGGRFYTIIAFFATMSRVLETPQHHKKRRVTLLMAAAMFKGASIGPLIALGIRLDPSTMVIGLMNQLVDCAMIFVCFSVAAMLAKRGKYLDLGGLLTTYIPLLVWRYFVPSFLEGSSFFFKLAVFYFAMLVYVGYIVVDIQQIIEKAYLGDLDYVKDARTIFLDLTAVFACIWMILLKEHEERQKKGEKRLKIDE